MKSDYTNEKKYVEAKKSVDKLKIFYIHLAGYIIVVGLIVWNFIIIEEGEYKNAIIWLNCTTLVTWGIFLFIHGWNTFKGRILFKKSWEERKIKEYMEADETKTWE